jgi:hypothetical protein
MPPMKINIIIQMETTLLRGVRELAAEEGVSTSSLPANHLTQIVRPRKTYNLARKRALARLRDGMDLQWTPPRSRVELHERRRLLNGTGILFAKSVKVRRTRLPSLGPIGIQLARRSRNGSCGDSRKTSP